MLGMAPGEVAAPGNQPRRAAAGSLFWYWAVQERGYTATPIPRTLRLTRPTVSIGVQRCETLAKREDLCLAGRIALMNLWTSRTPQTPTRRSKTAFSLCRCGQSQNKPFCDGTHGRVGFQSDDPAPRVSG